MAHHATGLPNDTCTLTLVFRFCPKHLHDLECFLKLLAEQGSRLQALLCLIAPNESFSLISFSPRIRRLLCKRFFAEISRSKLCYPTSYPAGIRRFVVPTISGSSNAFTGLALFVCQRRTTLLNWSMMIQNSTATILNGALIDGVLGCS